MPNSPVRPITPPPAPWQADTAAALGLAATQLRELLAGLDLGDFKAKLESDPKEYLHVVQALVKLHESGLKLEKHRVDEARLQLEFDFKTKPGKGLEPDVLEEIERELNLF